MLPEEIMVEYRDINLQRQGQIPTPDLSIKFQTVGNGVGSWSLQLPTEHAAVRDLRQPGSGVVITNLVTGNILLSGPTSRPSKRATSADPVGMSTIAGLSDDCILWDALAYGDPLNESWAQTQAYDQRSGTAESVMRQYVSNNIGSEALPSRRGLLASRLTLEANQGRGPIVPKRVRFPVLGDVLREIATVAGLRFRVVQRGDVLVFEISEVVDRSSYVRLDILNGTLDEQSVEFAPPKSTRIVVAGQGEGVERTLIERSSSESVAAEALWGRRMEFFKDQRNTDDMTELEQSGDEILEEDGFTRTSVKAVPSNDQTMQYDLEWREGDLVAVVVDGQETKATVTEAAFVVDSSGVMVGAAIGDIREFDATTSMRQDVTDTQRRVSQLERTVEVDDGILVDQRLPGRLRETAKSISNGDWNNANETGWYMGASVANSPNNSDSWGWVETIKHRDTYLNQIYYPFFDAAATYRRVMDNNVWGPWHWYASAAATNDYVGLNVGIAGSLILANGMTWGGGPSRITRVGKVVTLNFALQKVGRAAIPTYTTLAIVPDGWWPQAEPFFGGMLYNEDGYGWKMAGYYVNNNGGIVLLDTGPVPTAHEVRGSVSYTIG